VTTACSRCDRTPAAGFAHLDHKRYCQHEDPARDCYSIAQEVTLVGERITLATEGPERPLFEVVA